MRNTIFNTLKMMGVNGKDSVEFSDAYAMYHLTINPIIKNSYKKTLIEWHSEIVNSGIKLGVKTIDKNTGENRLIEYSDFNFRLNNSNLQMEHIILTFNYVVQVWYKENGFDISIN